jgi:Mg-chelatase subunit ChlD
MRRQRRITNSQNGGKGERKMKKTVLFIALILMLSVTIVNNVRAQTENSPVSAVGNWRPGDAHLHSAHSYDGRDTIADISDDAKNSGLDWIIITDHSYDMDTAEWQTARDECEAESDATFVVMCGEEISVDESNGAGWETGHYLGYGLDAFIENEGTTPPNSGLPIDMCPSAPDAQDAINTVNGQGVGFIAHPYNWAWDWDNWGVTGYTGIEVWNGGIDYESIYHLQAMAKWNELLVDGLTSGRHIVGIGGSDAHPGGTTPSPYEHSVFTFLDLPSLTPDAIADAYKGGHAIFSNGPFVSFKIIDPSDRSEYIVGDTVAMPKGSHVTLDISWDFLGHGSIRWVTVYKGTSANVSSTKVKIVPNGGSVSWTDPESVDEPCFYRLEGESYDPAWPDQSYKVYTNPIWVERDSDFHIAAISDEFCRGGETIEVKVNVENRRIEASTFWLSVSFKDPNGEFRMYDPQISIAPSSANLSSGESAAFSVTWTLPEDAPDGRYQIAVDCWKGDPPRPPTEIYTDNLDWANVFRVYKLRILTPTTSTPADAGDPNNPNDIFVRVFWVPPWQLIVWGSSVGLPEFSAKINDQPASCELLDPLIMPLFGEYFLRVTLPQVAADGLYDLSVTATFGTITDSDTEASAVKYFVGSPVVSVDVVLVIDRSGSMGGTKVADAKEAAKQFVDLMQIGDKLGVVSFESTVRVDYPLTELVSSNTKTAAKGMIDQIYAGGNTAVGGGLRTAYNQLVAYGDPSHPRAIVLLSDGQHNTGEHPNTVIDELISQNISVYTIGLGAGADEPLLRNIAEETHGTYHFAPDSVQLLEIYYDIAAIVAQTQTVSTTLGLIAQGETVQFNVDIDSSSTQATFTLGWGGSDLDLTLVRPDGTLIDPGAAAADPDIEYIEEARYEIYRINNPLPGTWQMVIATITVSPQGESYFAQVTAIASVTLDLVTDKDSYAYPEPIEITSTLEHANIPILNADVQAIVTRPDSSQIIIGLLQSDYGVYTNYLLQFSEDGDYIIRVVANGTTLTGESFSRETRKTVSVLGIPDDNIPPTTTLSIGEPKYISDTTYVIPDTPFTLEATDTGSGVRTTAYIVYSSTYNSGWQTYTAPFKLTSLIDGNCTIAFNSIDNVGNVENTNYINVTLVGPDINGDGKVDIFDTLMASNAFGSYPGHPRWNPIADINFDGQVDIFDMIIVARAFGKQYP